jgi:hypothetical protein
MHLVHLFQVLLKFQVLPVLQKVLVDLAVPLVLLQVLAVLEVLVVLVVLALL